MVWLPPSLPRPVSARRPPMLSPAVRPRYIKTADEILKKVKPQNDFQHGPLETLLSGPDDRFKSVKGPRRAISHDNSLG